MILEELIELTENDPLHEFLEWERDHAPNAKANPVWREYAQRRFRKTTSSAQQNILGDAKVGEISQNLMGQCLSQIAGRLRFESYRVDDGPTKEELDAFSKKNQLEKAVISLTKRVQTDGNAAMSVSWRGDSDGRPVIHHETWWDGVSGMFVKVSDGGAVEWALSEWKDRKDREFRTLFTDDSIIRYQKTGNGWSAVKKTDWTRKDGTPLGVPVAHFSNGASAYGQYGLSTVAAVLAAQDGLNASLFNRQLVVAFTGSQVYWAKNVNISELVVRPGAMWGGSGEDVGFGALPPGDISGLQEETEDIRNIIAGEFPVPNYRIGAGQWPSGTALQRADAPMIAQVKLLGDMSEPGLVHLAHRSTEMVNTFSNRTVSEEALITISWRPTDEVDPGTQVEIDQARAKLYDMVTKLPPVLIKKMDVLEKEEQEELLQYLAEEDARREEEAQEIARSAGRGDW